MKVGVLFVIIIVLLIIIATDKGRLHYDKQPEKGRGPESCAGTAYNLPFVRKAPEKEATNENAEYFGNCTMEASKHFNDCNNDCGNDGYKYAFNDFGAPGSDFKDWVASQAVDLQVIKNHAEYVADRDATTTQNITGRTFSPDAHDSYDPIPWVGLRRPQAVPTCNPTQVPDVDYNLYERAPKLAWRS